MIFLNFSALDDNILSKFWVQKITQNELCLREKFKNCDFLRSKKKIEKKHFFLPSAARWVKNQNFSKISFSQARIEKKGSNFHGTKGGTLLIFSKNGHFSMFLSTWAENDQNWLKKIAIKDHYMIWYAEIFLVSRIFSDP